MFIFPSSILLIALGANIGRSLKIANRSIGYSTMTLDLHWSIITLPGFTCYQNRSSAGIIVRLRSNSASSWLSMWWMHQSSLSHDYTARLMGLFKRFEHWIAYVHVTVWSICWPLCNVNSCSRPFYSIMPGFIVMLGNTYQFRNTAVNYIATAI